jgi:hypothetical protein
MQQLPPTHAEGKGKKGSEKENPLPDLPVKVLGS